MKEGKIYKMVFTVGENHLTYTGEILLAEDSGFIKFKDKFGKIWEYNKLNCISAEEIL